MTDPSRKHVALAFPSLALLVTFSSHSHISTCRLPLRPAPLHAQTFSPPFCFLPAPSVSLMLLFVLPNALLARRQPLVSRAPRKNALPVKCRSRDKSRAPLFFLECQCRRHSLSRSRGSAQLHFALHHAFLEHFIFIGTSCAIATRAQPSYQTGITPRGLR